MLHCKASYSFPFDFSIVSFLPTKLGKCSQAFYLPVLLYSLLVLCSVPVQDLIHDRLLDGDGQLNYHGTSVASFYVNNVVASAVDVAFL